MSLNLKRSSREQVAAAYAEVRIDVYRYLLATGIGPAQAQEITQDAFLGLYEALLRGTVVENLRAYLLRTAHNRAVNVMTAMPAMTEGALRAACETAVNDGTEQRLIEEERRRRLRDEVARLSAQQRLCLELRTQGLRYREIGEVLGISTSAVGEFLRRAVEHLRRAINE